MWRRVLVLVLALEPMGSSEGIEEKGLLGRVRVRVRGEETRRGQRGKGFLPQRRGGAEEAGRGQNRYRDRTRSALDSDSDTDPETDGPAGAGRGRWVGLGRGEGIFAPCSGCGIPFGRGPRVGLVPRPTRGYRLQRLRRWWRGLKRESDNLELRPPHHSTGTGTAIPAAPVLFLGAGLPWLSSPSGPRP